MASLEEIGRENHTISGCNEIEDDPERDEFMESYCEVLYRCKEELAKPFDEAFLLHFESMGFDKQTWSNSTTHRAHESNSFGSSSLVSHMASLLEEIGRENHTISGCNEIEADPERDEFMESYCEVLYRCKEELAKPFDEAFLLHFESMVKLKKN
ncbi:homeobox protein knotted-1-like 1 [Hibiscus syriacus]|uniref:homeobox protein knotted-1-like 1 n=1 Tax=Hibiscus syriacus TaxID=106335 RepID=UPI001923D3BA|nr:homeobox protein knotted-1-like 1 [Hibiscus syriacus]